MAYAFSIHKIKNEVYNKKLSKKRDIDNTRKGVNRNLRATVCNGAKKYKASFENEYSSEDDDLDQKSPLHGNLKQGREKVREKWLNNERRTYFIEKESNDINYSRAPDHKKFKTVNIDKEAADIVPLPRRKRIREKYTAPNVSTSPDN